MAHLRTQDFPYQLADQASFTANLLKIKSQEKIRDRRVNVTSPTPLEVTSKRNRNSVHLAGRKTQTSLNLRSTARCHKLDSKRCLQERNRQII